MKPCPDAAESRGFLGSGGECRRRFVAGHAVKLFEQELPFEYPIELRTRDAWQQYFIGACDGPQQEDRSNEVSYPLEGTGRVGFSRGGHRDI